MTLQVKVAKDGNYVDVPGVGMRKLNPTLTQDLNKKGYLIEIPNAVNESIKKHLPEVDVFTRWASYDLFIKMVLEGQRKSLLAYGIGGVGKTYICAKNMEKFGLREFDEEKVQVLYTTDDLGKAIVEIQGPDYDYIKITGSVSAMAIYCIMYEHKDKLIVLDDCDSVIKDSVALNILKGALDTSGDGTIVYASSTPLKDSYGRPVPKRFKFKGRMIVITNIPKEQMNQQILSRSLSIDLSMSKDQTMKRLDEIKYLMTFTNHKNEKIEVEQEDMDASIDFFKEHLDLVDLSNINARTLGSVALIRKEIREIGADLDWKQVALNIVK